MENTKTLDYPYNVADYIMHLMTKGKIPDMDAEKLQICQKYGNWRQSPFSREQLISILEGIVFRSRKENSERHLAILQSRFRDGLSYTAIAKQVGVSSTVVQSSLRHSLNAIIRKLELFFISQTFGTGTNCLNANSSIFLLSLSDSVLRSFYINGLRTLGDVYNNQHMLLSYNSIGMAAAKDIYQEFRRIGVDLAVLREMIMRKEGTWR